MDISAKRSYSLGLVLRADRARRIEWGLYRVIRVEHSGTPSVWPRMPASVTQWNGKWRPCRPAPSLCLYCACIVCMCVCVCVCAGTQFVSSDLPGYVGFANLPNQVHRKSVKKGFEFTLMVVGMSSVHTTNYSAASLYDCRPSIAVSLSVCLSIAGTTQVNFTMFYATCLCP